VTEHDDSVRADGDDGAGSGLLPAGDPSLKLFGHGWTPDAEPATHSDSYEGRHRAQDA
jgi:hypothetical protein